MEILPNNGMANLRLRSIASHMMEIAHQLASELEAPQPIVEDTLLEFAILSSRVTFAKDEIDFELAKGIDGPEVLAVKVLGYLNSECTEIINAAFAKMTGDSKLEASVSEKPKRRKK